MKICSLVGLPHGEHDVDKAESISVGSFKKVKAAWKQIADDSKATGTHDKYCYIRTVGGNNNLTRRFNKPGKAKPEKAKTEPSEDVKTLTVGAKKVTDKAIKAGIITADEVQEIPAGADNKIYKVEAEAYIKSKA